ncbi:MAG: START domain-containing protein [Bacteroidota bacterium]
MMTESRFLMLLINVLMFFPFKSTAQTSWEIDKIEGEIEIYTRIESDSEFKSFKAVMLVEASMIEIIEVLRDADNYTNWYGFTKTSTVLERHQNEQYNYVETIFPWPYKNRDMVYKMSIDLSNPAITKINLSGIPNYIPQRSGIVRMQEAEGYILLRQLGQQTEITYVFHSEPGDNIPAWLANNSITKLPLKTLSGLRTVLMVE